MNEKQNETLNAVTNILESNSNDKSNSYEFMEMVDGEKKYYKINREEHLNHVIDWAVQELKNNFEIGEF